MQMRTVCVGGLAISLTQVVKGQVGIQFRPVREEQAEAWENIADALTESERLILSDRLDGFVTFITNFSDIEGAVRFLRHAELKPRVVPGDEFKLVPRLSAS